MPLIVHLNVSHWLNLTLRVHLPGRLLLIVDDNPIVRQALCGVFTPEGDFNVCGEAENNVCGEAENGQEAVEKAQLLQPDLIVTDLSMPVMNGLEEARC